MRGAMRKVRARARARARAEDLREDRALEVLVVPPDGCKDDRAKKDAKAAEQVRPVQLVVLVRLVLCLPL